LNDAQGNAVVEINIFNLPAGQKAAAGVIVVAPLETLLTQELALRVDATKGKRYPFAWCTAVGCVSRIGITADELNGFRQGSEATVTIFSVDAPRQPLTLTISLKGFTAGFNAMLAANQAAAQ
jgi:invasion protein IalB